MAQVKRQYGYIPDQFTDLGQVSEALKSSGMPSCELAVVLDFSGDNETQGRSTFFGEHLHRIILDRPNPNPYQYTLFMLAKTMMAFDSDNQVPLYGAWEELEKPVVFPLATCALAELLDAYNQVTPKINTSGALSWKAVIDCAINLVISTQKYHILFVITCGALRNVAELREALVLASRYPLSVVAIGVGDGPFDALQQVDDEPIPDRLFDNFNFVTLADIFSAKFPDIAFALAALQEIPSQYSAIRQLKRAAIV